MILSGAARHVAEVGRDPLELQQAVVDEAGIAFRARHGDFVSLGNLLHRVAGADHRRNAQLAGDDRGVAGASAAVGDDGRGALHDRFPVGIGHVRDQHVALLELVHLVQRSDHPGFAGADLLADRTALDQHLALLVELEAFDLGGVGARFHRFRTRLHDVQLAGGAVLGPFDVHRALVVFLDDQRLPGQRFDVGIIDAEGVAQLVRRGLDPDALARLVGIHHALLLGAQAAPQHRLLAGPERRLEHVEFVRIHRALHDHFAEAIARGHEHHVAETGFGVEREQHAGRADVRAHHQLHAGREEHLLVLETVVHAIGDRAVVVERRENLLDLVQHVVDADHVEEGFLLPGKTGVGEVLGGGGRAHRDRDVAGTGVLAEFFIRPADGLFEVGVQVGFGDPAADFLARCDQRVDVVHVQRFQALADAFGDPAVVQVAAIGIGRGGEPARYRHAQLGKVADHLAQRSVLAADPGEVGHAQLVQPKHEFGHDDLHVRAGKP